MPTSEVEIERAEEPKGILSRSLKILRLFVHKPRWSPSDIAREMNLSRSTTYRILNTLCEYGLLERMDSGRQLSLGFQAAEIGMAAVAYLDVAQVARVPMQELAQRVGETVFLAVNSDDEMVYVHKEMGWHAVAHSSEIGQRNPLHCTSMGRAFLSNLPDAEMLSVVHRLTLSQRTPQTITDVDKLIEDIRESRARGYAIDNCENVEAVACCGASILNYLNRPVASLSVAGPAERILAEIESISEATMQTAASISKMLGHARQ
ncbi:MAG: IclR family transcriptional regulator [Propionibacteriaceae bacterium]|nr:IclR family transcriptional regulator [Propionibacteriaceae bacterium]